MDNAIDKIWNADITSFEDGMYTIHNDAWNQDIKVGGSVNFGFTAKSSGEFSPPKSFYMPMSKQISDNQDYNIEINYNEKWYNGYSATVNINNISNKEIMDWSLEFEYINNIQYPWCTDIKDIGDGKYTASNMGFNHNIRANNSISFGFIGYGNIDESAILTNTVLYCIDLNTEDLDSDNDGLKNSQELYYGTNPYYSDTDGDGLPDLYELENGLNPLLTDSDNNGILDVNEDSDNDGLNTYKEYSIGSYIWNDDTEGDDLKDGDEVNKYFTNPLIADTDGDGINDGDEVLLNINPLQKDSDGNGVLDNDEKTEQIVDMDITNDEKSEITSISLKIDGTGNVKNTTKIKDVYNKDVMSTEVVGLIGVPIEITSTSFFDIATITFHYNDTLLGDTKEEDLAVMWYDKDKNTYQLLDTDSVVDQENNTVSYTTTHFSTYMVVDRSAWYKAWSKGLTYTRNTGTTSNTPYFDIGYVIDKSGSMSGISITTAKTALDSFISAMYQNDRGFIVGFDHSVTLYSDWTNNQEKLHTSLSSINADGGTSVDSGLNMALEKFEESPETINSKIIVLLCDGDVNCTNATVQRAVNDKVKIYSVLINSVSGKTALQYISDTTGGVFYLAEQADKIREAIYNIKGDTIGDIDITDLDGDGLYDIYETAGMMLPNGKIVYTDSTKKDTDGDGLTDGEEMGMLSKNEDQDLIIQFILKVVGKDTIHAQFFNYRSNPNIKDTDQDGLNDKDDQNSLVSDIDITELATNENKNTKYVNIKNASNISFGENQAWFLECGGSYIDYLINQYGCGVIAASDILLYLSSQNEGNNTEMTKMITKNENSVKGIQYDYESYINYINNMEKLFFPLPKEKLLRGFGILGPVIAGNMNWYFEVYNINHSARWAPCSKSKVLSSVKNMLNQGIPVLLSYDLSLDPFKDSLQLYEGESNFSNLEKSQYKISSHYMNVTKVIEIDDKVDNSSCNGHHTILEVSSWGEKYYIDYDEYISNYSYRTNILGIQSY